MGWMFFALALLAFVGLTFGEWISLQVRIALDEDLAPYRPWEDWDADYPD